MQKVVFIPGLGETGKAFYHQIGNLGDMIDPIIFDYDAFETTDAMVGQLVEILPTDCTLVGHSMGGFLAQKCAAQIPVKNLILINTWAKPTYEFLEQNKMAFEAVDEIGLEAMFKHQTPLLFYDKESQLIQDSIKALLEKPPEVYKRLFHALSFGEDLSAHLPKITARTLIIHGRHDVLFSQEQHQHMQNLIPGAKMTIIEESGHVSPIEQPQAVTALLRLFIGE